MSALLQFLLAVLVLALTFGPVGRYGLTHPAPDLTIVVLWTICWFGSFRMALIWAVAVGLIMDISMFTPFGMWTLIFTLLAYGIYYVRRRFFDSSAVWQAIVILFLATVVEELLLGALEQIWPIRLIILVAAYNAFAGLLLYYLLSYRFKLFQQWAGKRL